MGTNDLSWVFGPCNIPWYVSGDCGGKEKNLIHLVNGYPSGKWVCERKKSATITSQLIYRSKSGNLSLLPAFIITVQSFCWCSFFCVCYLLLMNWNLSLSHSVCLPAAGHLIFTVFPDGRCINSGKSFARMKCGGLPASELLLLLLLLRAVGSIASPLFWFSICTANESRRPLNGVHLEKGKQRIE